MLCQRHTQVVLALCLLLVLWQCFRAPLDGLGPFPGTPSLLDTPADHCTASANGSTWFNTRYNMVMGPLLMGAAHELPSDVVQWWLVSGSMAGGGGRASMGLFLGSSNLFAVGQGQGQVGQMPWGMKAVQGPQLTTPTLPPFCLSHNLFLISHPFFSVPSPGLCWDESGSVPL